MKLNKIVRYAALTVAGVLIAGTPAYRLVCPSVSAADQNTETLNNASVIAMQELSLGDGVILDKIKTSKCDFDVTLPGLKQLKGAKVSDVVIQAMIGVKTQAQPVVPLAQPVIKLPATGDANDPAVQHEPGVWLYQETNGVRKMSPLSGEPMRSFGGQGWGPFPVSKRSVVLQGASAKMQINSSRPVFYIYFGEESQKATGIGGAASPSVIPLAKLIVKNTPKRQERLLVVGSSGIGGSNSGIDSKDLRAFESEKTGLGVYKVIPTDNLADGEYAFCYYGTESQAGGAGRMFCFGVHQ